MKTKCYDQILIIDAYSLSIDEFLSRAIRVKQNILVVSIGNNGKIFIPKKYHYQVDFFQDYELEKAAENDARAFYIEAIDSISSNQKIMGIKYLEIPIWWHLDTSEKSIWLRDTLNRLYHIRKIQKILNQHETKSCYINIQDTILLSSLKKFLTEKNEQIHFQFNHLEKSRRGFLIPYIKSAFREFLKLAVKKWRLVNYKNVYPDNSSYPVLHYSIFPEFWENGSGKLQDKFFQSALDKLKLTWPVFHLAWGDPLKNFQPNKTAHGEIYFLEKDINLFLSMFIFSPTLYLKAKKLVDHFSTYNKLSFHNCEVGQIFIDDLYDSFSSTAYFRSLFLNNAIRSFFRKNYSFKFLLTRFESHAFEKVLLSVSNHLFPSVGFQHSIAGPNFLNYRYFRNIFNTGQIPFPHYLMTTGSYIHQNLISAGMKKENLKSVGPLRFSKLFHYLNSKRFDKSQLQRKLEIGYETKIVFLPMSQLAFENISILEDLDNSLKQSTTKQHLIFKFNPNRVNDSEYTNSIKNALSQLKNLTFQELPSDIPLYHIIDASDFVLLTGGSTAIEAMILGKFPIVYSFTNSISHNPIESFPNSTFIVNDSISLANAMKRMEEASLDEQMLKARENAIEVLFGDIKQDPIDKFLKYTGELYVS